MRANLGAIWANFTLGLHLALTNRAERIGMVFVYLILLLVFSAIFAVFPVEELGVPGLTRHHLLWYVAVTEVIVVGTQGCGLELSRIIAAGQVTTHLQRPVPLMAMTMARMLGTVSMNVALLSVIGYAVLVLYTGQPFPVPFAFVPLFFLSILLGAALFLCFGYTVSMIEILGPYSRATNWIINKSVFVFGGVFFPVIFFPDILRHIVFSTPFPSVLSTPAQFVLGITPSDLMMGVYVQIMWLIVVVILAKLAEYRMVQYVLARGD